jgi:hypothetical protein
MKTLAGRKTRTWFGPGMALDASVVLFSERHLYRSIHAVP